MPGGLEPAAVRARLARIRERIASAGGDPERVTVVAVTKGQPVEAVRSALGAGLGDIGENYATELLGKAALLEASPPPSQPVRWHFLGAVQRNKVPRLAGVVSCWQSVARPEEAEAIGRRAPGAAVFVEIDLTALPGRGGCPPEEAARVVEAARRAGCTVRGLMTVAPLVPGGDARAQADVASRAFARVAGLAASLGLGELSMGMSQDLEQAVAAGSTMVRIGTALFGERPSGDPRTGRRGLQQ